MTRIAATSSASQTRNSFRIGSVGLAKSGMSGPDVRQLQEQLKKAGFDPGAINGTFGPETEAAVRAFQQAKGLQLDGIAGQQTWGALYGLSYPPGTHLLRQSNLLAGRVGTGGAGIGSLGSSFEDPSLGAGRTVQSYVQGRASTVTIYPVGQGQFLRGDAAKAYLSMQQAARAAGFNLTATSGFRTNEQQKALYQKYLNGTGNLAARPGYSNHQNGISIDIGGSLQGYGTAAFSWLKANASKYGFVNDVGGEWWHWTYKR